MNTTPDEGRTPPAGPDEPQHKPEPRLLGIEEFARLELRAAKILEAAPHPNADRLLKLQIDLGSEQRQLVAGIAASYRPEDLVGRTIVVVANLKPARLRGELSQGMLLAASDGDVVSLLVPDKPVSPGSAVG